MLNPKSLLESPLKGRFALIAPLFLFYLGLSFATRLALFLSVASKVPTFPMVAGSFAIGFVYDLVVGLLLILPILLSLLFQNEFIYRRRVFPVVTILFTLLILTMVFTRLIPKDFSPVLYMVLVGYITLRLLIYITLYLVPSKLRMQWRKGSLYFMLSITVFLITLNELSEWFFWNEFSSRFNFIAVDYLVYTSEVLGNIWESYPVGWILVALALLSGLVVYLMRRFVNTSVKSTSYFISRLRFTAFIIAICLAGLFSVKESLRHFSSNEFANALAGNGLFEFAVAYQQNELDFHKYYRDIDNSVAFAMVKSDLQEPNARFVNQDSFSIERDITYAQPGRNLNVVMITVESLSAEYMGAFGNVNNITPGLDSLAQHSLLFTNLYASGNRTVRGLEALSLSIPPLPGESTIKRPDNSNLFSLGSVLKSKGYITQYLYGGYSYFDNMKSFFSTNGYTVIDRSVIPDSAVHYQNIWGVADEDLFDLALSTLDSNARTMKPFFSQIMTVSNHRPYTYPDGRIDIPPSSQTRYGAVKYTDYAISRFLHMAANRTWFKNTIFMIVADHCAGSAGSVKLPVTGYHIPLMIYAPGIISPGKFQQVCAQIDIAPTLLGLLKMDYRSKFFGHDLLTTASADHGAFLSTYEGLGYLRNGKLVIQSPVKKIDQYLPDFISGNASKVAVDENLANLAIAYYQCADWLLRNKKQNAN